MAKLAILAKADDSRRFLARANAYIVAQYGCGAWCGDVSLCGEGRQAECSCIPKLLKAGVTKTCPVRPVARLGLVRINHRLRTLRIMGSVRKNRLFDESGMQAFHTTKLGGCAARGDQE